MTDASTTVEGPQAPPSDPVERFVAGVRWQFARTMWKWPHWYVLDKWNPDHTDAFRELARRVVEEGKEELWAGNEKYPCSPRVDRYYVLGDYKYWAWPGATLEEIFLINRARVGTTIDDEPEPGVQLGASSMHTSGR